MQYTAKSYFVVLQHYICRICRFYVLFKKREIAFGWSRPDRSIRSQSVDKKLVGFFFVGEWVGNSPSEQKGCVAHIVRLIDYQVNTKIDPPGVDFAKALIFSQTNNVCNAPFLFGHAHVRFFPDIEYLKLLKPNKAGTSEQFDYFY